MVTFDALRFDVAEDTYRRGETPFLEQLIPAGWEMRHTPGSFTYAAHAAFFAGFWPTPIHPASASSDARPFALKFQGSRSVGEKTWMLDGENVIAGLRHLGYHTLCIGGTGFFNRLNPLGSVFPDLFDESHWSPEFSVTELHSTRAQVERAIERLDGLSADHPLFLFMNVSATHAPTHFYLPGARGESIATQSAALRYVDRQLPPLFEALQRRGRAGRAFLMSDHGTLFGEDGYTGHRVAHPHVWNVPYAEVDWGDAA
jgi:hypothetical protein